jgi:membrane carboxypeptidase/penicillin-binding protein
MRLLLTLFAIVVFSAAVAFATIMGVYAYYARDLPDPSALSRRQLFQTARILDRQGRLLQEINDPTGGRRILVPLSDVPRVMRDATIAAEDASFYDNPGFDVRAVLRSSRCT